MIEIFLLVLLSGCANIAGECETGVTRRLLNNDNTAQAITVVIGCGATTSPSYGVRIIEGSDTTDIGTKDNTILGSNVGIIISWLSHDTLTITNPDTTNGHVMKNQFILPKSGKLIRIVYLKNAGKPVAETSSQIASDLMPGKIDNTKKNSYDADHLKQGEWDIVINKKIKGYQTFKNDTLHGPSRQWINYPDQIMTQEFHKGIEHGLRKYFEGKSLTMVVKFDMGKQLWTAFPSVDAQFPKPVKGGSVSLDSAYIECPYSNDTIWYRGLYLKHKPVGIHKMYYPNGKPRFEYNYSTSKIKTFDSTGGLISDKKDDGTWLH